MQHKYINKPIETNANIEPKLFNKDPLRIYGKILNTTITDKVDITNFFNNVLFSFSEHLHSLFFSKSSKYLYIMP